MKPAGTLNVGQKDMGPFNGHPTLSANPQIYLISTIPISEALFSFDSNIKPVPLLAESWSISDDFLTWTFNVQKGVQLHKGYGAARGGQRRLSVRGCETGVPRGTLKVPLGEPRRTPSNSRCLWLTNPVVKASG